MSVKICFQLPKWSAENHLQFMDEAGIDFTIISDKTAAREIKKLGALGVKVASLDQTAPIIPTCPRKSSWGGKNFSTKNFLSAV